RPWPRRAGAGSNQTTSTRANRRGRHRRRRDTGRDAPAVASGSIPSLDTDRKRCVSASLSHWFPLLDPDRIRSSITIDVQREMSLALAKLFKVDAIDWDKQMVIGIMTGGGRGDAGNLEAAIRPAATAAGPCSVSSTKLARRSSSASPNEMRLPLRFK